jgi:DNA-binding response OmpR family regulator
LNLIVEKLPDISSFEVALYHYACYKWETRTGLLQETRFNLYIVDIMMPLMDGFSFVKQLRKWNLQTPAIF